MVKSSLIRTHRIAIRCDDAGQREDSHIGRRKGKRGTDDVAKEFGRTDSNARTAGRPRDSSLQRDAEEWGDLTGWKLPLPPDED